MVTARRIAARAVDRIPEDPEWDEQGIRMELLR
jgi:predicted RNase H-like nuclease